MPQLESMDFDPVLVSDSAFPQEVNGNAARAVDLYGVEEIGNVMVQINEDIGLRIELTQRDQAQTMVLNWHSLPYKTWQMLAGGTRS